MERVLAFLLVQANQPGIRYFTLKDPDPEPTYVWVILNAFFFIGVMMLVMISLGMVFGGFRYWLLAKFPNNRFNGTDEEDLLHSFRLSDR